MYGKLPLEATHLELMDYIWRLLFNINHSHEVTPFIREQRNKLAAHYAHEAPANLFRYRPLENDIERELKALKSHKMWFSTIDMLNDPFETYVQDSLMDDTYNGILAQYPPLATMPKEIIEPIKADLEKRLSPLGYQKLVDNFWKCSAVSCLSESYDNKLMWSHYASQHKGMCIEYCTQELIQNTRFIMAPVNYSSEPPSTNINDWNRERFLMSAIFSKSSDWEYEHEWRCLLARSDDETYDSRTPFGEDNGVLLDTSSAKAVYLGCKIDNGSLERVINLCKDALNVPVYIMERKQSAYSLTPRILYSPSTVHD